ncbi:hypothetical protein Taro_040331 [Colocasia esculenta]|uniref:Uncharacterized protein n=1 Tax=Colocasia esculenta TaxID=4460 RepID=A0A843WY59_COLES|nr:hypothetical protein [Colocasia esculenta]
MRPGNTSVASRSTRSRGRPSYASSTQTGSTSTTTVSIIGTTPLVTLQLISAHDLGQKLEEFECLYKMEILPVNDLDIALHEFVNKDDKMAFYSCLQYNLEETRERVKERAIHSKESAWSVSKSQLLQESRAKSTRDTGSSNAFSDEEDTRQTPLPSKSTNSRGKASSRSRVDAPVSKRGRGRGSSNLKQMTLDAMRTRHSERSASVSASAAVRSLAAEEVDSASSDESEKFSINEAVDGSEPEERPQGRGRKRAAPRGRGRGSTSTKRGRQADNSSTHSLFMSKDDDDDDDDIPGKRKNVQLPVTRSYGALRKR